jgi:hypothetical protein
MHTKQEVSSSDQHPGQGRDDQDRHTPGATKNELGVLCERTDIQEDDEDTRKVGTNLRFGGSCSAVEELIPEV